MLAFFPRRSALMVGHIVLRARFPIETIGCFGFMALCSSFVRRVVHLRMRGTCDVGWSWLVSGRLWTRIFSRTSVSCVLCIIYVILQLSTAHYASLRVATGRYACVRVSRVVTRGSRVGHGPCRLT